MSRYLNRTHPAPAGGPAKGHSLTRSSLSRTIALAAAIGALSVPAVANADESVFSLRMLPHSYVTFQVKHPPQHQRFGYFAQPTWRKIQRCDDFALSASHHGKAVHVRFRGHRLTNPHGYRVSVRGSCRHR